MNTFQQVVLTSAITILIICLAISGYGLVKKKQNAEWPPITATCPDYWVQNEDGNCVPGADFPKAEEGNVSTNSCNVILPITSKTKPNDKAFAKAWAKSCNLTWDGITNNNSIKSWVPPWLEFLQPPAPILQWNFRNYFM